ncbi:hypothetical protein JCM10212_002731 [Sporobolomyces blumeae]
MSLASSPAYASKRSRADVEESSPSGKRTRTFQLSHSVEQPQAAPPTPNFSTTLAIQRQQAFERMEIGAAEREDVDMGMDAGMDGMDGGNTSDGSSSSNPRHPWNVNAPQMAHQASMNSLSTSVGTSPDSMPTTPLDGTFNYQTAQASFDSNLADASYPSRSNPTSFTDMNGTTHVFQSSSPPLSVYAPLPRAGVAPAQGGPVSHGFVAQAYANAQQKVQQGSIATGVVRIEEPSSSASMAMDGHSAAGGGGGEAEVVRELAVPAYCWDYPRQSNSFSLGGHLV